MLPKILRFFCFKYMYTVVVIAYEFSIFAGLVHDSCESHKSFQRTTGQTTFLFF